MSETYIAADGTYGDATGMLVIEERWAPLLTEEDWQRIDTASDSDRLSVAVRILHFRLGCAAEDMYSARHALAREFGI